ncbi:hypothetical protein KVV02_004194 [Mortierella alpina]|uniref:Uncharacterized protein n=1 Tax=Mortierella alpina TaxID=64518 RepID=A0A9P8CW55_MORAP|nr:hypothetical protein KVV02_004194 [Mortierella alpina]
MAFTKKQPTLSLTNALPSNGADSNGSAHNQPQTQQKKTSALLLKRKPVKATNSSTSTSTSSASSASGVAVSANSSQNQSSTAIKSTSTLTPPSRKSSMSILTGPPLAQIVQLKDNIYPQIQPSALPLIDAEGVGMGMKTSADFLNTPKTPKTFKQSQDELFSKLEQLAAQKNKGRIIEPQQTQPAQAVTLRGRQPNGSLNSANRSVNFQQSNVFGGSATSLKSQSHRPAHIFQSSMGSNVQHGSSSSFVHTPVLRDKPRELRRRLSRSQFKTPSTVEMAELAQVVVANATPPKIQNKVRKRASTLSLTTTTFMLPRSRNNSNAAIVPPGAYDHDNMDYRQAYETALKESRNWEKKYSSVQHQLHFERECWEEKFGEMEKTLRDLENSKAEANLEKMNTLLDTVQELQLANEVFRRQLVDAGIEPDPMPSTQFHSHHILVGENLDRTFLEENELLKQKSLVTNRKIADLSTEITKASIAISQTVNYVQLRYLTQLLDAAEHVSNQKRSRAMSNSFLSDMLARGVKKPGPLQPKNTSSTSTQTPQTVLTALQLQQQQQFQQQFMHQQLAALGNGSSSKLNRSFTSSLLHLAGLSHSLDNNGSTELQYRLKGGVMDDRSQLIHNRTGIPPVIIQNLKGSPTSPESVDRLAASRTPTPLPKFQYASPTSSQLHIFVPDAALPFGFMTSSSAASGSSRAGSMLRGIGSTGALNTASSLEDGSSSGGHHHHHHHHHSVSSSTLRRSSSDCSLTGTAQPGQRRLQQLQNNQQQQQAKKLGLVGKYPYPNGHSSRPTIFVLFLKGLIQYED